MLRVMQPLMRSFRVSTLSLTIIGKLAKVETKGGERLEPGIQVTTLTGEIVAAETHGGIGRALADMLRRVHDQRVSIADEIVLSAGTEAVHVGRIPIGRPAPDQIADAQPCHSRDNLRQRWSPRVASPPSLLG